MGEAYNWVVSICLKREWGRVITCERRSLSSASKAQSFGLSSLSSASKAISNPPKWFSSDPPLPTSKLLSTETTTKSCCTSRFRSLTVLFWTAWMPSRNPSRESRLPAWTACGALPAVGTRPNGADSPLPPPRPSASSTSMATPSRSSLDTSQRRGSKEMLHLSLFWTLACISQERMHAFSKKKKRRMHLFFGGCDSLENIFPSSPLSISLQFHSWICNRI